MAPGGHLETRCSKARSGKNGWACMCSRVAVSSETGINCLAPRRSLDKSPLRLVAGTWEGLPLAQGSKCAEE